MTAVGSSKSGPVINSFSDSRGPRFGSNQARSVSVRGGGQSIAASSTRGKLSRVVDVFW